MKDNPASFVETAHAIASALGCQIPETEDGWPSIRLVFDWGGTLFLEEYKDRILVCGLYPHSGGNYWGPPENHKISASATKSPDRIAKDIESRLLPAYKAGYLDAVILMNEYSEAQSKREGLAKKLSDILGAKISRNDALKFHMYDPVHLEGTINSNDVTLRIVCSDELAERICREIVEVA